VGIPLQQVAFRAPWLYGAHWLPVCSRLVSTWTAAELERRCDSTIRTAAQDLHTFPFRFKRVWLIAAVLVLCMDSTPDTTSAIVLGSMVTSWSRAPSLIRSSPGPLQSTIDQGTGIVLVDSDRREHPNHTFSHNVLKLIVIVFVE